MDKKLRNLLILAGILAVLCVGYAAVGMLIPREPIDTEPETEAEAFYLFHVTEDGLTSLSFTYDHAGDGTAEFWDFLRSEAGGSWAWRGNADVPLGNAVFYNHATVLASAMAVKVLRNVTPDRLETYGLATPCKTVYFTDAVGGEQSFCVGAYNAYNGTYCVYINGDPTTVYLVEGNLYDPFEQPIESFVTYDDLPSCKPEAVVSLTLTQGDRTVVLTRGAAEGETGIDAKMVWRRSVNGGEAVELAAEWGDSLERLVGDMDYLTCYSVSVTDFPAYGLDKDTTRMTLVYRQTVGGAEVERAFELTLGSIDKYGYYYANPEGTPLTMLLGGAVFHKVMTGADGDVSAAP